MENGMLGDNEAVKTVVLAAVLIVGIGASSFAQT
jgi:hypothetical protein